MTRHTLDQVAAAWSTSGRLSVGPAADSAVRGTALAESTDASGTGLVRTAALRLCGTTPRPLPAVHTGLHWALDVDSEQHAGMLDRADVILGHCPRPEDRLMPEVGRLLMVYPGCGLAMLPGVSGAWIGAPRTGVPFRVVGGSALSLLPSCLYGWTTAGHAPQELAGVTPLAAVPPDAARSAPHPRG